MIRKLMKYEFMATGRVFLPLFAALLIVSAVNRLFQNLDMNTPAVIGAILSVVLIVGILVLTLILTLQRFRNNLLSGEGYLMMTLPTRADGLILSKLFVASIWNVASFIVVVIAIMIMALSGVDIPHIFSQIRGLLNLISLPAIQLVLYIVEAIVLIALTLFAGILLLYTCMSLSMLVNKRRGLFTFGAYVVITTVMQTLFAVLVAISAAVSIYDVFSLSSLSMFGQIQVIVLLIILCEAILCAVFYFITRFMLERRLNLQ